MQLRCEVIKRPPQLSSNFKPPFFFLLYSLWPWTWRRRSSKAMNAGADLSPFSSLALAWWQTPRNLKLYRIYERAWNLKLYRIHERVCYRRLTNDVRLLKCQDDFLSSSSSVFWSLAKMHAVSSPTYFFLSHAHCSLSFFSRGSDTAIKTI